MFAYGLSQKRAVKLLPCFLKLPAWWIAFLFTSIHCYLPSLYSSCTPVYFSFTMPLPFLYPSRTAVFTVPADSNCEWFVIKILNTLPGFCVLCLLLSRLFEPCMTLCGTKRNQVPADYDVKKTASKIAPESRMNNSL
jgi:hypothetical protein